MHGEVPPPRPVREGGPPATADAAQALRLELAVEAAGIGSFDWDLVTGRLDWDDRLLELFGYTREEFGERIEAFAARLHPDDVDATMAALQHAVDTCGAYDAEFRVLLPSGDTRWVRGRGRALCDEGGTAVRLLGAAYDTTSARAADLHVARVLEAMNEAFFSLDRDWRFSYVNRRAEQVLDRPRGELVGGEIWELFPHAVESAFEENYRGAAATGQERVFEAYYPAPLDAWYEVRAWPTPDGLSVYFLDVTERRHAETRAREGADRLRALAEISAAMVEQLGRSRDERAALQQVTEAVVPVFADWAIATLIDEDGRMRDVASWHADPALRATTARYAELRLGAVPDDAPVLQALASGQALTVSDVPAVIRPTLRPGEVVEVFDRLAPRSALTLPLTAHGRTLGALSLYRGDGRRPAGDEDVAAAREVAERVALALDNARLHDQQRRLAEELQRSMLTEPPRPDHAEVVVRYLPAVEAAQVGGDWYDAFLQPGGATVLVIGDVVGHDIAAAAAMGQLRGLVRGIAFRAGAGPATVLADLDTAVHGLEMQTMATAIVARIEQTPEQRAAGRTTLRWSNAGHPPPLLLHGDGRVEELSGARPELMLGVDHTARRTESAVTVDRPATVLLYTDGLVEARDQALDDGIAALREALADLADRPLAELCDGLLARLRPHGVADDVALVAVRLHPEDRPRPPEAGAEHVPRSPGRSNRRAEPPFRPVQKRQIAPGRRPLARGSSGGEGGPDVLGAVLDVPAVRAGQLGDQVEAEPALAGVAADGRCRRPLHRAVGDLEQPARLHAAHRGAHPAAAVPQGVGGHLVEGEDEPVAHLGVHLALQVGAQLGAHPRQLGDARQRPGEAVGGGGWGRRGPDRPGRLPRHAPVPRILAPAVPVDRTLAYARLRPPPNLP